MRRPAFGPAEEEGLVWMKLRLRSLLPARPLPPPLLLLVPDAPLSDAGDAELVRCAG